GLQVERLGSGGRCFVLSGGGLGCFDHAKVERVLDSGVSRVAVGNNILCIADQAGVPWCWAINRKPVDPPEQTSRVTDVSDVEQLVVTWNSACALTRSGDVECWPFEGKDAWKARTMSGMPPAVALAGIERHVCAVTHEGQLWCWGRNFQGELGDGTVGDRDHPVRVKGIPSVVAVAGADLYTCARTRDEQLWCWGEHPLA